MTSEISNSFSFHEVQHHEVWALLRSLDGKKSTVEDQIPPKLPGESIKTPGV